MSRPKRASERVRLERGSKQSATCVASPISTSERFCPRSLLSLCVCVCALLGCPRGLLEGGCVRMENAPLCARNGSLVTIVLIVVVAAISSHLATASQFLGCSYRFPILDASARSRRVGARAQPRQANQLCEGFKKAPAHAPKLVYASEKAHL